ncbi:MAG: hypothetical protein IVW55_09340 [Chloroflexi bacterium]|nr:hypothetical protein [Chloroflexota bacterium]
MNRKSLLTRLALRSISLALILAVIAVAAMLLLRTAPLREIPAASSDQVASPAGAKEGANSAPHPYTTVSQRDFGTWKYAATSNDIEGLHATINYDRDTIAGIKAYAAANKALLLAKVYLGVDVEKVIKAYAAANKALLPEVIKGGGVADVAVTFVYPMPADWFRTWAKTNSLQVTQALLRTGAPGSDGGTVGVGGTQDDPLPQSSIDNLLGGFFSNNVYGVFGLYGRVDTAKLGSLGSDPHVFLVDVTPTYVRRDIRASGITNAMQEVPRVELPFAPMERMGLQNFTKLALPTSIPAPEGTVIPIIIPPAP